METQVLLQTITIALLAGIAIQVFSAKFKIPPILFLMLAGILLGPEFLGWVQPASMGNGLIVLVNTAVGLILFEGGLSLDLKAFKKVNHSIRTLLLVGLPISTLVCSFAIKYILDISWFLSLLYGSIISITGPTVISPILQRVRLKPNVAAILKTESIIGDPLGAFVAVGILEFVISNTQGSVSSLAFAFVYKIFIGISLGIISGYLLGKTIQKKYIEDDLKNLVVFAWVIGTLFFSNMIESHSGILTVAVAGLVVQNVDIPQITTLKKFKGQISVLMISILFVLISANLELDYFTKLGWRGLIIVLIVMFVARPIAIFSSMGKEINFKEKIFLSLIGPKGIVSASITSLFTIILLEHGFADAKLIEAMVFLTIVTTVAIQGFFVKGLAQILDTLDQKGTLIIVGANSLGRTLATAFKEMGKEVVLIDNNQDHCDFANQSDLTAIRGNALDEHCLEQANITHASTLIATTSNSEINFLVCQMAKNFYGVPEVYPAIDAPGKGVHQRLVDEIGGNLAYAKPVSIQEWKNAIAKSQVKIADIVLDNEKGGKLKDLIIPDIDVDNWIPLILKRKNGYFFVHADQAWSKGDILIYLVRA